MFIFVCFGVVMGLAHLPFLVFDFRDNEVGFQIVKGNVEFFVNRGYKAFHPNLLKGLTKIQLFRKSTPMFSQYLGYNYFSVDALLNLSIWGPLLHFQIYYSFSITR